MSEAKKVKVGIVGSKFAGVLHMTAYERIPWVEVTAVSGRNAEQRKAFAERYSIPKQYATYQELVADPDVEVVSICLPNFLHREVALAACEHGKHVICEKPIATTMEDALEMTAAFEKKGLRFMYAEDWNFAPAIVRAKEIIDQGAIGEILYIKAKETHNGSHSPYAQTIEYCGGGSLIHLGIHPAAFVRFITGQEVVEVVAKTSPGGAGNLVHKKMEGEDWGAALLTLENGTFALIEGNYITQGGMDDTIEIYGTKGVVKLDLTFGTPLKVYSSVGYDYVVEKADLSVGWTTPAVDEFYSLGYQNEMTEFTKAILEDKPVPLGGRAEDGVAALAIVKAAYISAKEGRPVNPLKLWKERS